jgi:hypothetical protein
MYLRSSNIRPPKVFLKFEAGGIVGPEISASDKIFNLPREIAINP